MPRSTAQIAACAWLTGRQRRRNQILYGQRRVIVEGRSDQIAQPAAVVDAGGADLHGRPAARLSQRCL